MKFHSIVVLVTVSVLLASCATIFKGSSAEVRFNSSPAGADILINDIDRGTTPQTISLKRNSDYLVTFKKDGYEDVKIQIDKKFDIGTTVIGNIFSWGLIGIIVDVANGSAYSLTPADLQANLPSLQAAGIVPKNTSVDKDEIHVFMLTEEEWANVQVSE